MSAYTKEQIARLTEGRLDWDTTLRMLSMPKDKERFLFYLEVLQDRVPWDERIVLPLGPKLYIAQNKQHHWRVKCECGHEFCDWRENWKLHARIYVRDTPEAMREVYPQLMAPDTKWQVYREYYCPVCHPTRRGGAHAVVSGRARFRAGYRHFLQRLAGFAGSQSSRCGMRFCLLLRAMLGPTAEEVMPRSRLGYGAVI
jgi:acetone carboxylase gamma subunit